MISVTEALEQILAAAEALSPQPRPVGESLSLVLAEDIVSTIDSPPHDKSLMDGYAVRLEDARAGVELRVLEQVTAGETPRRAVTPGTATRIMTGAPLPSGAEAIVIVEQTESLDDGTRVRLLRTGKAEDNILRQGTAMRSGECVLRRGRVLRPMELALLAEIGVTQVAVVPRPSIAILATGNELVPFHQTPAPGQIRNSNGPMLVALSQRANAGGTTSDLGIARDEALDLKERILRGFAHDVLVMSGGVSAGVMDLIPTVLQQLGARQVFHHVNLKPGKPLWFGTVCQNKHRCLVFGLPGNPVSSLVCFELFVKPALAELAGQDARTLNRPVQAVLTVMHEQRDKRLTYYPARLDVESRQVTPLPWKGSADIRTLVDANALAIFSDGPRKYAAGDTVDVQLL